VGTVGTVGRRRRGEREGEREVDVRMVLCKARLMVSMVLSRRGDRMREKG
jgi:hypothetical protein